MASTDRELKQMVEQLVRSKLKRKCSGVTLTSLPSHALHMAKVSKRLIQTTKRCFNLCLWTKQDGSWPTKHCLRFSVKLNASRMTDRLCLTQQASTMKPRSHLTRYSNFSVDRPFPLVHSKPLTFTLVETSKALSNVIGGNWSWVPTNPKDKKEVEQLSPEYQTLFSVFLETWFVNLILKFQ